MTSTQRWIGLAVVVLVGASCGLRQQAPIETPPTVSGFLDDYSLLRRGGEDDLRWIHRSPSADWPRYDAVLIEPVTLWRSGKDSLAAVPEDDLQDLVNLFERAIRHRLGERFRVAATAGSHVMRIRVGIVAARADDAVLDVMTAHGDEAARARAGALDPQMHAFIAQATVEGEIRDAESNVLLAQGVDRRRDEVAPAETWAEVERRLTRWVDRVASRLEARTDPQ